MVALDGHVACDGDHLVVVAAVEVSGKIDESRRSGRNGGDAGVRVGPGVNLRVRKQAAGLGMPFRERE